MFDLIYAQEYCLRARSLWSSDWASQNSFVKAKKLELLCLKSSVQCF